MKNPSKKLNKIIYIEIAGSMEKITLYPDSSV